MAACAVGAVVRVLEEWTDKQRIAHVQSRGLIHRLEVGHGLHMSALSIPVMTWATKLDPERGREFIVSALKSHRVEWNEATGRFEVGGEALEDDDLVWPITREFTHRWRDLDVRIWYNSISDLSASVCFEDYDHSDVWVEKHCVDAVQDIMQRMLTALRNEDTPVKIFTVKHMKVEGSEPTEQFIPALCESHALWKWTTESSGALFTPWDLVQECINFCEYMMGLAGLDEIEDLSWTNENTSGLMEGFMRRLEHVVTVSRVE